MSVYGSSTIGDVGVPVTSRLDPALLDALDRAVAAGLAPTRAAAIARAVAEWVERHDEEAIVESYRRRYAEPDPAHDALVEALSSYSASVILAEDDPDAPR